MLRVAMKSIPAESLGTLRPTPFAIAEFRRAWLRGVERAICERGVPGRAPMSPGGFSGRLARAAETPAHAFGSALDPG